MRSNIINASIANVITRFVKATSMLRANNVLRQQWHLNVCAGALLGGNSQADLLLWDMSPVAIDMFGRYLPSTETPMDEPGLRQLFQRLS